MDSSNQAHNIVGCILKYDDYASASDWLVKIQKEDKSSVFEATILEVADQISDHLELRSSNDVVKVLRIHYADLEQAEQRRREAERITELRRTEARQLAEQRRIEEAKRREEKRREKARQLEVNRQQDELRRQKQNERRKQRAKIDAFLSEVPSFVERDIFEIEVPSELEELVPATELKRALKKAIRGRLKREIAQRTLPEFERLCRRPSGMQQGKNSTLISSILFCPMTPI